MSKRPRASLQGTIKPAQAHSSAITRSHDDVVVQLRDDDVPDAALEPEVEPEEPSRPASRSRRTREKPVEEAVKDYAHRSLYAMPETLDLIRRIAFEERTSAQALYREGLFLMLRKRGHFKDKRLDDV